MRTFRRSMTYARATLLLGGALYIQTAAAQTAAPAAPDPQEAGSGAQLEDIVVTAQRRAENLQDVPIAVSAVTASTAARLGLNDSISLSQAIPGLNLGRTGNSNTPFIRGVGTNAGFVGNEPSVATFIDDVYVPTGAGASFDFNNIDSIEVLKGPQGTLFGRNATGGVIHVHTRNPTYEPTGDISVGYGNYDTLMAQAYASVGLSDKIAANAAFTYTNQADGWGNNIVTGRDVFKRKSWGVRAKLLAEPTDRTNILLSYSYDYNKTNQGVAIRSGINTISFGNYNPDAAGAGFYDGTANADDPYRNSQHQVALRVRHDLDNVRIVSITAYNYFKSLSEIDTDTTPTNLIRAIPPGIARTFTQELQLLSAEDAPVQWVIGGFYLRDHTSFEADFSGIAFGNDHQYLDNHMRTRSLAGFAQATAEILARTRLTLGIRYTSDKRRFDGLFTRGLPGQPPTITRGPFEDSKSFSSLTGRFAIDYKPSDDVLIYAAFNRGFKSGVYNLPSLNAASTAAPPPVDPEDLNAYSIGFKSEFLDRRVRLNAEGWLYEYKNIQVVNQVIGGQILTNAGAARIKGVDIDLTAVPVENLTLTAAVSIADGHYTRFPGGPTFYGTQVSPQMGDIPAVCTGGFQTSPSRPHPQIACNLKGNKTIQTVPLAINLVAAYRIPTEIGNFDLTGSWAHGGDFYWEADNDPDSHQKKTDLFNASIQWSTDDEGFSVRLWARNIGKEKYYAYGANSATSNFKYSPAPPRTYGVTLSAHF